MIQWKQRLYAFLLRQVLGPFLDASSIQKLHDSIEFSFQEGTYVLKDIGLNAAHLTEKIANNVPGLSIRKAKIQRLEIQLSLRENNLQDDGATSSLAWRAMKLGTTQSSLPAVSLVAEIRIHGVELELEPCQAKRTTPPPPPKPQQKLPDETDADQPQQPSSKSIIGSYVDAALSSLQLSLKLTNISVKLCQKKTNGDVQNETWVAVRMSSISLKDLEATEESADERKTNFNKLLELSEIELQTGETYPDAIHNRQSTFALAEGLGQVYVRIAEEKTSDGFRHIDQDFEFKMNQQLNFSADPSSLIRIQNVAGAFADVSGTPIDEDDSDQESPEPDYAATSLANMPRDQEIDEEDLHAISGIMRQYREAYHLAEKNQLQRGMLVPSHAFLDEGVFPEEEDTTYDVFFDANDQSFYNTASVLMQSVQIAKETPGDDSGDSLNTKLRFHLASVCLKAVFRDPDKPMVHGPEEYILLTMNDLICDASSVNRDLDLTLNISHLQVEDAQLNKTKSSIGFMSVGGSPVFEGSIEIGSLLEFVEQPHGDNFEQDILVSQAPCIALHLRQSKPCPNRSVLECEIDLLPIELSHRERTFSNLATFASHLQNRTQNTRSTPSKPPKADTQEEESTTLTKLQCSCPSITLSVPLSAKVETLGLFERCGEITNDAAVRNACMAIRLDHTEFEWREESDIVDGDTFPSEAGGKFSCHHLLVSVSAPVGDEVSIHSQMQRMDLFLATGRLEIDPITPISVHFQRNFPGIDGGNCGKDSFPIVPSISTFKARQEDEDEDMKIDKMLFSKLQDVDADSRKELRGSDPQLLMMAEAEKCDSVVTLNVPEIVVDLTKSEIDTLLKMMRAISPNDDSKAKEKNSTSQQQEDLASISSHDDAQSTVGIATNFSQISISIREDPNDGENPKHNNYFSCLLAVDELRTHSVLGGSGLRQFRFLALEPCLYSAYHCRSAQLPHHRNSDVRMRVHHLKQRISQYSESVVSPIVYRSHLFNPISHATPSLLLDVLNVQNLPGGQRKLAQMRVHLTLYHLTYRYDVDSDWMQRVLGLLPDKDEEVDAQTPIQKASAKQQAEKQKLMTRLFISVADLNLDYSSASYFETASRSIIRIGDFRFSSNIMVPAAKIQSYSLSLGDFSYHVCNLRHPYTDEDQKLCRASDVMGKAVKIHRRMNAESGPAAETLLREMSFVNVLSLDSLDAIIATTSIGSEKGNARGARGPKTTISLTLGLLSVHACKDSFGCFASTVGEVQAKLTALTDDEIYALKKESESCASNGYADLLSVPDGVKTKGPKKSVKSQRKAPQLPASLPTEEKKETIPFLLDGYDWTTIDHDPLRHAEIPDGDEQIAMWYDNDSFPGRIIHHHFPMHSLNDPLSDGDMGASTYGGKGADLRLKSRLLVHKLTVKLRFFDGYDWPERLSPDQRAAAKVHKRFVIEPLPNDARLKEKADREKEAQEKNKSSSASRKSQLMAGLLDGGEDTPATFANAPLPEERAAKLERQADLLLFCRKSNLYFQVSANGVTVRIDSFEKNQTTRLVSIMDVAVSDLFIAETASLSNPIKLLGEWVNDTRHPRDTRFGMLMMKMVTWNPLNKVSDDGEIENDDCEVTVGLLPTRCIIDQRAVTFVRAFFHSDDGDENDADEKPKWNSGLHVVPPPRFRAFRVKPWKLKVDYYPIELNVSALRDGSLVELVNVSPIDGMVITLSQVSVEDVVGFGSVLSGLLSSWVQEICATQLHKFLANARPFEPITDVGQGITDLVVLPYEAFKNGDDIRRAMQSGVKSLAETVIFQTLATTSRLTHYAASTLAGTVTDKVVASNPLPSRPFAPPRGVSDVTGHAAESLARGIQAANYRVVIVPYREYSRRGATGAASSIIKGIPVLLVAPLTGATEALSYTLLGARNALRPDLRKEEEATRSGFNSYDP